MAKKKKAAIVKDEPEGEIYGGEEIVTEVVEVKEKPAAKPKLKKLEAVSAHGYQRAMIDGHPHLLMQSICNKLWACAKEVKGKPYHFQQGEPLLVFEVDRSQLLA